MRCACIGRNLEMLHEWKLFRRDGPLLFSKREARRGGGTSGGTCLRGGRGGIDLPSPEPYSSLSQSRKRLWFTLFGEGCVKMPVDTF